MEDTNAVYAAPSGSDDTVTLQEAINEAQEAAHHGILFLAPGNYQVTNTIYVWPGVRVIGYGAARPKINLPANTAGFGDPQHEKVLFFFAGRRPRHAGGSVPDATPGTFYSALANVDVHIGEGNRGAVGVRARYAQHCFLAHMDFQLGDALAGIHEGGNVVEDVRFFGGTHAVWTSKPSPGWQFTFVDCAFEGQRESAIYEHEAGLTLVRPQFRQVPTAVEIETNWADELWVKDARLENIAGPAFRFGMEKSPRNQIHLEGVACREVPVFALMTDSGTSFAAPSEMYYVTNFSHGLDFGDLSAEPKIETHFEAGPRAVMPAPVASDLIPLPAAGTWANVRELGAKGDGRTDDTAALQAAIAGHQTLYFPSGFYLVHDTLALRSDTVLIGLHPGTTQIILPDGTPAFAGTGRPKGLIEAPKGGRNVVIGLGLYTSGNNPRAVAALWKAGTHSMMNDVRFLGGHGTPLPDGSRENPYNDDHSADPNPHRHWNSEFPSLWVTDGGGGTFFDIWTPSTFARAGMEISDTETPGRVYQLSSEHHVQNELIVRHARHWNIYALQTEEERGESGFCLPIEIDSARDITIANFHSYRVISSYQPFPQAVMVSRSSDIHFRNFHCDSNSKVSFDSSVDDPGLNLQIRQHEFAALDIPQTIFRTKSSGTSVMLAPGATVEKLADGFFNIAGGAVDGVGNFYFVDSRPHRIYRWDAAKRQLATNEVSFTPVNLTVDAAGNLMVVAYEDAVYALDTANHVTQLTPQPLAAAERQRLILPMGDWVFNRETLSEPTSQFVSPDGTDVLPVGESFLNGETSWGVKSSPQIRSFGLAEAVPGRPFYVTDESFVRTWKGDVDAEGRLRHATLFAEIGGESVATDSQGNVYIAAGQIYVYDASGQWIDTIRTPRRPVQIVFAGKRLYITSRDALYAVDIK